MIRVEISKSTGRVTHVDQSGNRVVVDGLPPQANIKAIEARIKAKGLKVK